MIVRLATGLSDIELNVIPKGTLCDHLREEGPRHYLQPVGTEIEICAYPDEFVVVDLEDEKTIGDEAFAAVERYAKNMPKFFRTLGIEVTPDEMKEMVREEVKAAVRDHLRNLFLEMLK